MITKRENRLRHINIGVCLLLWITLRAQVSDYLTNRVKIGDICYVDGGGVERFIDHRSWDQSDPPGDPVGVVVYSYYGPASYDLSGASAWHGWLIELDESEEMAWAPTSSICYANCVATYAMEGINTPFNPHYSCKEGTQGDTCGWQNTRRLLEFVYEGQSATLSDAVSPVFYYIFTVKNGVTDFSVKPAMGRHSWFLPSFGQLRYMYGGMGLVNAALHACGGTTFVNQGIWWSSSEVGTQSYHCVWSLTYGGTNTGSGSYIKSYKRKVRAFRNF